MKLPIKRFATSALALLLALSMLLSVAAEDIEFSGIPGGGGLQNNSDGTPKYNVYSVKGTQFNYQHLVGYRFSVVTKSGQIKNNTHAKNIFLAASYSGATCYATAFKANIVRPKTVIRQDYEDSYVAFTNARKSVVGLMDNDSALFGIPKLPLSPDGSAGGETIEAWCTAKDGRLEALLIAAGVIGEKGLAILDNTDRILVEPIFELTLGGQLYALTLTEIAVQEYRLYKEGYNDKYGRTYTAQGSGTYYSDADYETYKSDMENSRILEAILRVTNSTYPNFLKEDGEGIPEGAGAGEFWYSAEIGYDVNNKVPYLTDTSIISCIDLIEHGFGVAVVWKNTTIEETRVKLQYHPNGGLPSRTANNKGYDVETTGLLTKDGVLIETIIPKGEQGTPEDWTPMDLTWDALGEESGKYPLNTSLMWNTEKDGSGDVLVPDTKYDYSYLKGLADENGVVILYAIWDEEEPEPEPEDPKQLIVKYHANGGTVGHGDWQTGTDYIIEYLDGVDVTTTVSEGKTTTLANWSNYKMTRDGYTLNEDAMWKPNASGTGQTFTLNTSYSYDTLVKLDTDGDGVVVLYAVWTSVSEPEKPDKIYLRYHTNGGTVSKSDLTQDSGYVKYDTGGGNYAFFDTIVYKGKSNEPRGYSNWGLAKEGYILNENLMWNTKTDGNGKTFKPGVSCSYDEYLPYAKDGVVILYAAWDKEGTESEPEEPKPESITVVYSPNGGSVGNGYAINGGVIYKNGKRVETVFPKNGQTARLCDWDDFGLTRSGYELWTLDMWNPSAKGDGESLYFSNFYSYDDLIGFDTDKDGVVILYAVWQKQASDADLAGISYTIYFYVDGKKAGLPFDGAIIRDNYVSSGKIKRTNVRKGETSTSSNTSSNKEAHLELKVYQKMSPDGAEFILFDENITAPLGTSATYTRKAYFYSINYYSNSPDGSSIVVPDVHYKIPGHDATISPLVPFCSGWEFVEWNTKADGSGVGYAPKDVYGINERLDLYAIWKPSPIRITINCYIDNRPANFMDGSVVLSRQDGATIEDIALPTDKSFYTVSGVDGCKYVISAYIPQSDEPYYPIAEASASNPLVAKAVEGELVVYEYSIYYYTITYKENLPAESSASVSDMPAPNPQYVLRGEEASISGNSPRVTDSKHTFVCWRTTADKTGNKYRPNQTVVLVNSPLVLYAQWINIPSGFYADLVVKTYIDNQGTNIRTHGLDVRAEQAVTVDGEEHVIDHYLRSEGEGFYHVALPFESPYRVITTDENGVDWYLKADGSYTTTVTTLSASTSRATHDIYYYPVTYRPNPPAEGDVGNMPEKQYALKGIEERLSTLTPTREDEYGFVNWNTHANGDEEGTAYAKGARVTLTAPLILYAQWKKMTCELVFEAIVQGATTKQFVDDIPGAIWVETEEGNYPIGKNGTVTVTLPKGTKYRLRAIYETGGTVYPYTAKGNYEDTEFTLTKPFTHHGIYYYAINYYYGSTLLETPYRHYKLHGVDVKVSTDEPSIDFGTSLSRFLNVWDQPAVSMRYMPGAVYNLDQKGDLYAVTGVKVAYNVNGGTVGEGNYGVREDGLITRNGEIFFILLESEPPFTPIHYPHTFPLIPPQSNYEFVSWNEDSEGEGEVFVPGSVYGPVDFYSCDRTPDGEYAILYADWNPLINTVHFEATPEGYGTVELDEKPVSAVSGIPRGSEMYFENGQVVIEPIVSTPITVSYEDGSEESCEGGKFVFRAVPADPTSQYSYKHIGWEGVAPEIDRDITVIASFDREGAGNDIAIVGNPINGNPVLDSKFALSANIINNSDIDITPNMGIDAVVVITKNGSSEPVKTYRVENICVPKRGSDNATLSSEFIKKEGSHLEYILYDNSNLVFTEASVGSVSGTGIYRFYWYLDFSHAVGFTDADSSNDESARNIFRAKSAVSESNPSRPVYSTDIPSSFKGKEAGESAVNTFSWSYYEYNPSAPLKFVKRTGEDGFKILLVATPENEGGLKKEERVVGLPDFTTRAGYGFSLHRSYSGLEAGDLNPSASAVFASKDSFGTLCALMYYPEFDYSTEAGKFSKLLVSAPNPKGDYRVYALSLPEYPDYQTNDINDKYAHYIPMWYPDKV